jgi:hypothetical protein
LRDWAACEATSNKKIFWGRGLPSSIALTQQVGKLLLLTKFIAAVFFLPAKIVKTEVKTTKT